MFLSLTTVLSVVNIATVPRSQLTSVLSVQRSIHNQLSLWISRGTEDSTNLFKNCFQILNSCLGSYLNDIVITHYIKFLAIR
jgi:hypothetical protein